MELSGWGRYPRHRGVVVRAEDPGAVKGLVASHSGIVARGNGRAYGDAAIGETTTLLARPLDRMRRFEAETGRLTVEAGVLLSDILDAFVPRGFFPPVVPGTKLVTVGGMIAADVHGKNHHRDGGFGDHVEELTLAMPSGERWRCSRDENPELFAATIGGMGLTGVILDATFRLKRIESGWLRQRTLVAEDLAGAFAALEETSSATYSVAWIDCLAKGAKLGRSLIYAAEHASAEEVATLRPGAPLFAKGKPGRLGVPLDLPAFTLNSLSVAAFNELYFRRGAAKAGDPALVHWDPYFFPLDGVGNWNRIYGGHGFVQHQCVIPAESAKPVLAEILGRFARAGKASFLAVLKQLGPSSGTISFGMAGYTLALDLQVSDEVFTLLDEIDGLVVAAGGRLYLAKDARQSRATFEAGYPGLAAFRDMRRGIGAEGRLSSRLSARLGI
jgi:FAD/FMN-containing dehydrogenase